MKLKFDANQSYQLDAVRAVVDLFAGQPGPEEGISATEYDSRTSLKLTEVGLANNPLLTPDQWLANVRSVQQSHALPLSEALEPLRLVDQSTLGGFPNFTVEMETGTGKTYVYLRSIHELHKTYGFKKFVIVVPSVAIREGVLKSLEITREHFQTLYDFERVEFSVYDSSRVTQLRNFALSDALQILVINIDAFAKDSDESSNARRRGNVINQRRESGVRPIEFIQSVKPIVILDEPQNLETDKRKHAIARLKPTCTLRYSATHRDPYNLIYSLDPVRAYQLGLVKQISVDSVVDTGNVNQAFVEVDNFHSGARSISAKATIWVNQAKGPKKKRVTLKNGDDLFVLSRQREIYRDGFIVNEIDAEAGFVRFANDVTVRIGVPHGVLGEGILRQQIEATVRRHFEKAQRLAPQGVKVLSVFFIDRVSSYRVYNTDGSTSPGPFAQWFEEIYERYRNKPEFTGLFDFDKHSVHNGYFAQDKKAVSPYGETTYKTKGAAEGGAFELIMRDKERLLDAAEPLQFIFSHSALREGWDNPNVFQICTLAETRSEIKKRQEIGRGLRLCVNQDGERIFDRSINRLTVIANETYEDFALQLQSEMEQDGVVFDKKLVKNERDKIKVKLRKGYQTTPAFLDLWQRIRQRTRYRVHYDTGKLVQHAAAAISKKMPRIEQAKIAVTRADVDITTAGVKAGLKGHQVKEADVRFVIPDLIGRIQDQTGLSRSTVARILLEAGRLDEAMRNPQVYVDHVVNLLNDVKQRLLVDGVEYIKLADSIYEMQRFEADDLKEWFKSNVFEVSQPEKTLFSHIIIDGDSGPERRFAQACDANDDVLFYIKLPRWFVIDTPVGKYNPDWALAYRNDDTLYFVAETKGESAAADASGLLLRPLEQLKIDCGKRHFRNFEQVRFKVTSSLEGLLT